MRRRLRHNFAILRAKDSTMTSATSVTRNREWVAREYGREKWPAILSRIDAELGAGETDLSRVVNRVKRWETGSAEGGEEQFVVADRLLEPVLSVFPGVVSGA